MTPKNSAKAKLYKVEIDRVNDKWDQVVRLEQHEKDEACQRVTQLINSKIPTDEDFKLIRKGGLEQLKVCKAILKMAKFHDQLVVGKVAFNKETRQEYLMAYNLFVKLLKANKTWKDRQEEVNQLFNDDKALMMAYAGLIAVRVQTQYQLCNSRTTLGGSPLIREAALSATGVQLTTEEDPPGEQRMETTAEIHHPSGGT